MHILAIDPYPQNQPYLKDLHSLSYYIRTQKVEKAFSISITCSATIYHHTTAIPVNMPSKGISFTAAKPRTKPSTLSTNPKTAATRKWERDLGGLTLALHRINKAATVAKSRATKKLKSLTTYTTANESIREKLLNDAIAEIERKRDAKREEAHREWIELYGEKGEDRHGDEEEEMEEEGQKDSVTFNIDGEAKVDEKHAEPEFDDGDGDDDDDVEEEEEEDEGSEYSEAVEAPVDEVDVGVDELSPVQQEVLTGRLFALRQRQAREHQEFIKSVECAAKERKLPETPDDFIFGYGSRM